MGCRSIAALRDTERRESERGFTLVELLVIVLILAILFSIAVFAVVNAIPSSSTAACKSNFKTVETAAETFKAQVGTYPSAFSDLTSQRMGLNAVLDGPWIKEAPNTYTPGATPTITNKASYGLAIDTATQSIAVGTIKANGAQGDSGTPLVDGNANCSRA